MFDVVALGEALVDFTYYGQSEDGNVLFEQTPGGAPVNMLATSASLGLSCAFIGKVGADERGAFFRKSLQQLGIDVSGMVVTEDAATTISFVQSDDGVRNATYMRKPGADSFLDQKEVNTDLLEGVKIFHFGSVSLSDEPSRSATIRTARAAKAAGAIISYDPNYRAALWKNADEAIKRMKGATFLVDVVKVSLVEMEMMTGTTDPEEAAKILFDKGPTCVIITLDADGALVITKEGMAKKTPPPCNPIDTNAAGDIFFGAFLYRLATSGKPLAEHNLLELEGYIAFANAAAGLSTEKRGGVASVPELSDIYSRVKA